MKVAVDPRRPFEAVRAGHTIGGHSLDGLNGRDGQQLEWRVGAYLFEMGECFECCFGPSDDLNEKLLQALTVVRDCETVGDCPVGNDSNERLILTSALALKFIDEAVISILDSHPIERQLVNWDRMTDACRDAAFCYLQRQDFSDAGARSRNARLAAEARHSRGPYAEARAFARECWSDWQARPSAYRSLAEFARDIQNKFPDLIANPVTVERWVRQWRAEIA